LSFGLLGVQLDDELLSDRFVDLLTLGTTRTVTENLFSPISSQPGTVRSKTSKVALDVEVLAGPFFRATTSPDERGTRGS